MARHILQLFVTGELRGSIRVPDDVLALSDGLVGEDVPEAMTRSEDELSARIEDIADLIVDVEPFTTGDDSPKGRSLATSPVCSQPTTLVPGPPAEPREVRRLPTATVAAVSWANANTGRSVAGAAGVAVAGGRHRAER